ncbi:MAG: ATP-binding protein [Gammaproteobacteria bacterium]
MNAMDQDCYHVIGKPVDLPGFAFGLRTPSVVFTLAVNASGINQWLDSVHEVLVHAVSVFAKAALSPLPAADGRDQITEALLYWIFQFQRAANLPVFEQGCLVGIARNKGYFFVAIPAPARSHQATKTAVDWLLKIFNMAADGKDVSGEVGELPEILKRLNSTVPGEANVFRFLRAAYELSIPFTEMPGKIVQFGQGVRSRWLDSTFTDETSVNSARLARNKVLTAAYLRQAGVPVPSHIPVETTEAALEAAERLGYPVVVKPADRDKGAGVASGLLSPEEVREAFALARKHSSNILVEKHFDGRDYRLTVFHGELVWAVERVPGGVTGDGISTVRMLIDRLNADPNRGEGAHSPLKQLTLDDEAIDLLRNFGLNEDSVPPAGEFIRLRRSSNIATGGMPVAVFDKVHPDNRLLAIRAAAALRLDVAGVDLLIPDIGRSWRETGAAVCEVNGQPQLGGITSLHLYPDILRALVKGNGRIPIAVVLGEAPEGTLVPDIGVRLKAEGFNAGWIDQQGVTAGGVRLMDGPVGIYNGGHILLSDKSIEAVIIRINNAGVLYTGLPFDRYDILVLAGSHIEISPKLDKTQRDRIFFDVLSAILPACRGGVVNSADSGLEFEAPNQIRHVDWINESVEHDRIVDKVAAAMHEADAGHRENRSRMQ